jgi:hypothetical protein
MQIDNGNILEFGGRSRAETVDFSSTACTVKIDAPASFRPAQSDPNEVIDLGAFNPHPTTSPCYAAWSPSPLRGAG